MMGEYTTNLFSSLLDFKPNRPVKMNRFKSACYSVLYEVLKHPQSESSQARKLNIEFLKRRAIVVSNLIIFKLDCRTTVDSNVEFNLVVPDSTDWNVEPG